MIVERFTPPITDLGSFDIPLDPDLAPFDSGLELIQEYDHFVVMPGWFQHPSEFSESVLLAAARYAGVILEVEHSEDVRTIRGAGMSHHLGDSEGVGPILEVQRDYVSATPATVLATGTTGLLQWNILPGVITGTSVPAFTATDAFFGDTQRAALDVYLDTAQMHARVNPNGTLDACRTNRNEVFRFSNKVVVASREGWGQDPGDYIGVQCSRMMTRKDGTRAARKAISITRSTGTIIASDTHDLPYEDIHGADLRRTVVFEGLPADLTAGGFANLSQDLIERSSVFEAEIDADTSEATLGTMVPGDLIWVFSPEDGFINIANEIHFRGQVMWPMAAQILELTWPTMHGQGYYVRHAAQDPAGVAMWTDVTPFVVKEFKEGQSFARVVVRGVRPPEVGCA